MTNSHLVQPSNSSALLTGVIEGFYGQPWSTAERFELFDWMSQWGLNTYVYAPKDDLKQRAIWRELYSDPEAQSLAELIRSCTAKSIRFVYALSPGLDIGYTRDSELQTLCARFDQMLRLGCRDFALLFDDIPDQVSSDALARWGSLASAQCYVANSVHQFVTPRAPRGHLIFCPTPYCGRMARAGLGGPGYLETLGSELAPGIDVFWTGPEIISPEISVEHMRELQSVLRRKPVIWDNLHANDYDGRRFYCGPYAGRAPGLRNEVRGLLANPNCEFPLNFVPLRTLARFVHSEGGWDERAEYLAAMEEWLPRFTTVGSPISFEDLVLLGDCYYLSDREGPGAEKLISAAAACLAEKSQSPLPRSIPPPSGAGEAREASLSLFRATSARLRQTCARLTELRDRSLFYSLSRRIWDLREELDLIDRFLDDSQGRQGPNAFISDYHLVSTYRGGTVARLQRLLVQQPDGSFLASPQPKPHS